MVADEQEETQRALLPTNGVLGIDLDNNLLNDDVDVSANASLVNPAPKPTKAMIVEHQGTRDFMIAFLDHTPFIRMANYQFHLWAKDQRGK